MSYRPICDTWLLARPKVRYYGAYPSGFVSRARALLGVAIDDPVLHVCAGQIRAYPFAGVGPNDRTIDVDPAQGADFTLDITTQEWPVGPWRAVLADPPYTVGDAAHYGTAPLPTPKLILAKSLQVLRPGGRVGILAYNAPTECRGSKLVALVGVIMGFNNNIRCYSVYEKVAE
jgi:hypothetical protein